jgi:hypothetical protein
VGRDRFAAPNRNAGQDVPGSPDSGEGEPIGEGRGGLGMGEDVEWRGEEGRVRLGKDKGWSGPGHGWREGVHVGGDRAGVRTVLKWAFWLVIVVSACLRAIIGLQVFGTGGRMAGGKGQRICFERLTVRSSVFGGGIRRVVWFCERWSCF